MLLCINDVSTQSGGKLIGIKILLAFRKSDWYVIILSLTLNINPVLLLSKTKSIVARNIVAK